MDGDVVFYFFCCLLAVFHLRYDFLERFVRVMAFVCQTFWFGSPVGRWRLSVYICFSICCVAVAIEQHLFRVSGCVNCQFDI